MLALVAQAGTVLDATSEILKNGVLGAAVVILGLAVLALWKENKANQQKRLDDIAGIQAQRVVDAQAVTTQLLRTNQECVTALTNVTNAMEAQQEAMSELKVALEKMGEKIDRTPRR